MSDRKKLFWGEWMKHDLIHLIFSSWVAVTEQKKKLIGHLSVCLIECIVWHAILVGIVAVNVCLLATLKVFMWLSFFTIVRIVTLRFSYILDKSWTVKYRFCM